MPAIPHILLLCVPVFASLIVIAALLSSKPVSTNTRAEYQCRPVAPYLVWISLTLLAVLTASFGVISDQHNGQILWITVAEGVFLSLLKTELHLCVIYIIGTTIPSAVVAPRKVMMYNSALSVIVFCSALLSLVSPFYPPSFFTSSASQVSALLAALYSIPIIIIVLRSPVTLITGNSLQIWSALAFTRGTTIAYSTCGVLLSFDASRTSVNLPVVEMVEAVLLLLWIMGTMVIFYYVPTTPSRSRRSHNNRSPVLSRNISISIDPADFRNLQDPFAPSPPSSPPADSDKGFFIPGVPHARTATSKFSKAKRKESETTLVAAAEKEKDPRVTLDESIDKEEAMLSQLLLRSLGGSNSSLQGPTECKDRDRDIVVVTCERRGSESTLASSGGGGKLGHRGSESTLASMSLSPSMPTFPLVVAQSSSSLIHHPHHFPGFETVNWHGTGTVLSTLYEPRDPSPSPLSLALHGEDEMSTDVNLPIPMHVGSPPSR